MGIGYEDAGLYYFFKLLNLVVDVYPPNCFKQDQLKIDLLANGDLEISEYRQAYPWDIDVYKYSPLNEALPNEFFVTSLSHGCVEISCDGKTIVVNPWLSGPSFGNAWWLMHSIPSTFLNRVSFANVLYISSSRADFCHIATLKQIAKSNPKIQIYLPLIKSKESIANLLKSIGFLNIKTIEFGYWEVMDKDTRFMLLPNDMPETHALDDSFILVEFKGRRAVYAVNAEKPNMNILPPCDVFISDYCVEPSAFPTCFAETMGEIVVREMNRDNAEQYLRLIAGHVNGSQAKIWVPLGDAAEKYPAHRDLLPVLYRPSRAMAIASLQSRYPKLFIANLQPGDTLDMIDQSIRTVFSPLVRYDEFDFAPYRKERNILYPQLRYLSAIQFYFKWACFPDAELILNVLEMSDDFETVLAEYWIDFYTHIVTVDEPEGTEMPFLKLKVHSNAFKRVMYQGDSWNHLINAMDMRVEKVPVNTSLADFWSHVRFRLPSTPPAWDVYSQNRGDPKKDVLVLKNNDVMSTRTLTAAIVFSLCVILLLAYFFF